MQRRSAIMWVFFVILAVATPAVAGLPVTNVTVGKAKKLIKERAGKADFVILDVRTPDEFAEGHINGAVNLDVQSRDFEKELRKLDREKSYLVYCRTGNRSGKARAILMKHGFVDVINGGGLRDMPPLD